MSVRTVGNWEQALTTPGEYRVVNQLRSMGRAAGIGTPPLGGRHV